MLTAIVLLPLLGFVLNGVLATRLGGNRFGPRFVSAAGCGLPIASFLLVVKAVLELRAGGWAPLVETVYRWALIGDNSFEIAFYFDRLSAVMALVVTGVGSVIHVYSIGYMKGDEGYGRFFAYLNLFLFFMLLLVLGRSLLVLFVGWEGVGLASYLLIGFWFHDLANARAGKKAFVTNRIGDAGFLLGMFVLFQAFGTLDMDRIGAAFAGPVLPAVSASLVGVLLFIGATGKSAQIPLHVWLPDAMAGPTPVSALIHAATMVTAGVYLVARMSAVYLHAPEASMLIAVVGVATAFFAATIALVQNDIKRVLAYSTVSQLGYMFLAMGVGAYTAGIFHLMTHAFFKALLFLGSGAVIHALAGEQDLRKMGGLRNELPITYWTFLVGALAIAGVPFLSGFFSKDEILYRTFASGHTVLWAVAALTSLMTAFYMFRLVFLAFHGTRRADGHHADSAHAPHGGHGHHGSHLHDAPPAMAIPLIVLAVGSVLAGYLGVPAALGGSNIFEHFLEPSVAVPALEGAHAAADHADHGVEIVLMIVSSLLALTGIGVAAFLYLKRPSLPDALANRFAGAYRFLTNKGWIDELYDSTLVQPIKGVSEHGLWKADARVIDGAVNGAGSIVEGTGMALRAMQTGSMRGYAVSVLLGVVLIVGYYLWA